MIKILKKMRVLLDKKQKRNMAELIILMIVGAIWQTAGVGMLVQAVNVIIDANALENSKTVAAMYRLSGIGSYESFSIMVMVLLILVFAVKNVFLFFQQKLTFAFVYTNQFRTSERMMRNYLRRGYEFYLSADTAAVQRNITSDVNNMYAMILAILQLMSDGVVSLFIVCYCLATNGIMTITLTAVIVLLMFLIKVVLKPIMHRAGEENREYYSGLFKWISQTVQGIKEVKVNGKEQYFVEAYKDCGKGYVNAVQKYSLYNNIPKLLMEAVCVTAMMGYMIVRVAVGDSTENMLDAITTLAAAAFVLLPCVNRINQQLNQIAYCEPCFMGVSDNLQDEIEEDNVDMAFASGNVQKLPVLKSIELRDITYSYPNREKLIFDHADMTIPVGKSVGIVGATGSGKSTIVDILLGLLEVRTGTIYADGRNVMESYRGWLKNIGYIPQMIFMLDSTIRTNVAFGVPENEIDEDRLWEALREAQLDEFVRTLPDGVDTGIGERGIQISGGQRQRIGIARALYHDPEVLVLDEATSALDNDTEAAVMDSINRLHGRKTLIIIAHRLQTIEKCDLVYRIENGKATIERGSL